MVAAAGRMALLSPGATEDADSGAPTEPLRRNPAVDDATPGITETEGGRRRRRTREQDLGRHNS